MSEKREGPSWGTLFDRADDRETTLAAVRDALERRRSGPRDACDGENRDGSVGEEGDDA